MGKGRFGGIGARKRADTRHLLQLCRQPTRNYTVFADCSHAKGRSMGEFLFNLLEIESGISRLQTSTPYGIVYALRCGWTDPPHVRSHGSAHSNEMPGFEFVIRKSHMPHL